MKTPILELFALTLAAVMLMYNGFMLYKSSKDSKKVFVPEMIDPNLKDALMQKHPYMELSYKQFLALLRAAPDQFSFWTLDEGVEGRFKGGKALAIQSASAGKFHRLSPNQYWEKCDMTSIKSIEAMIQKGGKSAAGLVRSKAWDNAVCEMDTAYWPILIAFGGELPSDCESKAIVDIPEKSTLIFFYNKKDMTKAFEDIFGYIQKASLTALGVQNDLEEATKRKLENSIKGSNNMLRDIALVQKKAERQVSKTKIKLQQLTLDMEQDVGLGPNVIRFQDEKKWG